ncbi:MAG TPA: M67 family metallopeptidase [Planctomycetota bacterium]
MSAERLALPADLRRVLAAWASRRYPREACGLLLGHPGGACTTVVEVLEARNLAAEDGHERFELDPADHMAAEQRAETLGLAVVGAWHSHPDQPAHPSERDRAAALPGWCMVIVATDAAGGGELRAWRVDGSTRCELLLEDRRTPRACASIREVPDESQNRSRACGQ